MIVLTEEPLAASRRARYGLSSYSSNVYMPSGELTSAERQSVRGPFVAFGGPAFSEHFFSEVRCRFALVQTGLLR